MAYRLSAGTGFSGINGALLPIAVLYLRVRLKLTIVRVTAHGLAADGVQLQQADSEADGRDLRRPGAVGQALIDGGEGGALFQPRMIAGNLAVDPRRKRILGVQPQHKLVID